MKLAKLELVGAGTVTLNVDGALPSDPYIYKGADGLGPTEVDVAMANGVLQSRRPRPRQMVIQIGLNPDYSSNQSVSELRDEIYGLLSGGYNGRVTANFYETSEVHSLTEGYVSKCEVVYFTEEPVVQVTIDCKSAYLYGANHVEFFPDGTGALEVENVGTAPTGFEVWVQFTSPVTQWTLYHPDSNIDLKMEFNYSFLTGDMLMFNTEERERYIRRDTFNSAESDIPDSLSADSTWLQLIKGENVFFTQPNDYEFQVVRYIPKYLGV